MKKNINIMCVLMAFPLFSFSAWGSAQGKAVELMELMEVRSNIDRSFAEVEKFSNQMIEMQGLSPEQMQEAKSAARAAMNSSMNQVKEIDWEGMYADVYAAVFSEEELDGLLDFYRSAVGKKFLEKQPELIAATMQKMQLEMAKIMPQLQADVQKAIAEAQQ